jgi:outer membrane protein assembly factor BamB
MKYIIVFLTFILISSSAFAQKTDSSKYLRISDRAIETIKLDGFPDFLAADGNDVWVTNIGKVQKLSANSKTPVLSVVIPDPCGAPIVAEGYLWIVSCKDRSIYKIDHLTGKVNAIIPLNISDPGGEISLAFGDGSLWILTDSAGTLSRIDPTSNTIIKNIKVIHTVRLLDTIPFGLQLRKIQALYNVLILKPTRSFVQFLLDRIRDSLLQEKMEFGH